MDLLDRVVAGLSCRDVLQRLSDFLDGELPDAERESVMAHLADCQRCERFGGRVQQVVRSLRHP